jgi:hypothetical protein
VLSEDGAGQIQVHEIQRIIAGLETVVPGRIVTGFTVGCGADVDAIYTAGGRAPGGLVRKRLNSGLMHALARPLQRYRGARWHITNFRFYIFRKESLQCGKWVWLLWPS